MCRTGGSQFALFGVRCRTMNTMVHELGHNLCLGHEHTRSDRDDYVGYQECRNVPGKDTNGDLRGSLYDYQSQMHYVCNNCLGGFSRQGVTRCGPQATQGLSVMDADKLNDMYSCGGCMAHRWRPIDALTNADRQNMVQFGRSQDNQPIYICRATVNGETNIGKYFRASGICFVPFGGSEHQFRNKAQVFTLPGGRIGVGNSYRLARATDLGSSSGTPVPCLQVSYRCHFLLRFC